MCCSRALSPRAKITIKYAEKESNCESRNICKLFSRYSDEVEHFASQYESPFQNFFRVFEIFGQKANLTVQIKRFPD
jgi:hypothetical protein